MIHPKIQAATLQDVFAVFLLVYVEAFLLELLKIHERIIRGFPENFNLKWNNNRHDNDIPSTGENCLGSCNTTTWV